MFRLSGTKTIPILLLLMALCGISPRSDALEPLRIATEGAYPPFSFFDAEGRLTGFDVEIAQALCQRLDRECQISAVPWNELLPGLRAGRYALIVASMAKTAEREQYGDFTRPYYRTRLVFIGKTGSSPADTVPAPGQRRVFATQTDTIFADYLRQHHADRAKLVFTTTLPEAYAALTRGEVDLVLTDTLSAYNLLRDDATQRLDIIGPPLDVNAISSEAFILVRKGDKALREAVNAALNALWLEGTYHKISTRYFPFDIY